MAKIKCTLDTCPLSYGYLHYRASIPGNSFMIGAFAVLIPPALYLGIRYKTKLYTGLFVTALVGEIIGYVGRILLNGDPFSKNNFLIYLICLTLAPVLMSAAVYLTLARIVVVYGENISLIRPRSYTLIFSGFDLAALIVQAIGGSIAAESDVSSRIWYGTHILVAGLSIQVASGLAFVAFSADFAWRVKKRKDQRNTKHEKLYRSTRFKVFLCSLALVTLLILIRTCYRCAELSGGFLGHLAQDQVAFMVLDGAMILSASILLTIENPAWVFGETWPLTAYSWGCGRFKKRSDMIALGSMRGNTSEQFEGDKTSPRP
ncbi:RTA1-domain-containing protein [Cryphonectria parasitica EP155]|uniref:RTA1-domain-containing protein n=1 Tax=Cryphonectria parasitica (strain ATCC 38755 / EP155) TaxID=660469 RepID=A0A9P4Y835_CRYP1|nr:RTA1-domain-containing protein [Cryphonectria parasitica EP155]KAF3768087.1 RTA1-domain-containing protein [Cryphonectria parasitica EP155]